MDDVEDVDPKNGIFDFKNLKESGVSWYTRFLLRFFPFQGLRRLTREFGLNPDTMEKANDLFFNIKRIDIIPSASGERGFQIILDKSTALYFYQDGDHFVYDGSETGEYESGEVTIFDGLKRTK